VNLSSIQQFRVFAAVAAFFVCGLQSAHAQGTAIVPLGDLAYADLDQLAERGVLDSVIIGQRPYSRREFARIVHTARARLDGDASGLPPRISESAAAYLEGLVYRLEARFGGGDAGEQVFDGLVIVPLDAGWLYISRTDADRRRFPAPHTSSIEATIDPLARRRLGTPAVRGTVTALDLFHRIEPASWLAFQAAERFEYRTPFDTTLKRRHDELLLLSARARFANAALTVGRQQIGWSQTAGDGLFLASDAPALDAISLAGDRPFVLPSFLSVLGSVQGTFVVADLGASVVRSHSKLLAYKVSIQPNSAVELGGTFMNHFGGTGAPPASLGNRLVDFFPFIDIFRKHNYEDSSRTLDVESDKLLGVDGRFRLDPLWGLVVTGEVLIDDFDVHRIPKLFTGYGSQSVAFILPQIGQPEVSLKLSAKHMGILTYSHGQLTNGITTRGRLLGDELGPDAKAYAAQLRWTPSPTVRFELEGRNAIYSNASYTSFYADSAHTQFVVQKVSHTADELRDRILGSLVLQTDDAIALSFRVGGERIRNANFQGGRRRDFVAEVALRIAR
jgi:hypothetical protein